MDELASGWDFGPGNYQDAGAWNEGWYGNSIDWGSFGGTGDKIVDILGGLTKTAGDVWARKTLMETSLDGTRYLMGQRTGYMTQPLGMNMGTLLLIGGGILVFAMLKD